MAGALGDGAAMGSGFAAGVVRGACGLVSPPRPSQKITAAAARITAPAPIHFVFEFIASA